ncbi:MAG: FAD-dependent oxidoreductase [Dehalococcoidales bacterium]|nr:FAD-dependent oxidoreductase [Dehalococcoidales bacterium]
MTKKYDVIIVGGGPAGIFAALELAQGSGLRVLLIEKGRDIGGRQCPARDQGSPCISCVPCHLVCGLGGAGAFSDGKLTLSTEVGGRLVEYVGEKDAQALIKYVDDIYLRFGASDKLYGIGDGIDRWRRQASLVELRLIPVPLRHLGTEHCRSVLKAMRDFLVSSVDFKLESMAAAIIVHNGRVRGVETESGEAFYCDYLVLAPGREGADWLSKEANRLHLTIHSNPIDVGVRVEVPVAVMDSLSDALYEAKLEFLSRSFDDRIRTFCMCPAGEVIMESTGGSDAVITVNGHSYADRRSNNTNFALLVSTTFTEPFREPIAYGKYIARLANILSGGVLVQRLGDLMAGHRSTPERIKRGLVQPTLKGAVPGDLSFVLPYRHLTAIVEMLQAMDKLVPGIASRHTLLYGVEVKFYSGRLQLSSSLETEVSNMFAVGDGAGVSRGLVQSSASGIVAAREIMKRSGH